MQIIFSSSDISPCSLHGWFCASRSCWLHLNPIVAVPRVLDSWTPQILMEGLEDRACEGWPGGQQAR